MADTNDAADMGLMCMIYIKLITEVYCHREEELQYIYIAITV